MESTKETTKAASKKGTAMNGLKVYSLPRGEKLAAKFGRVGRYMHSGYRTYAFVGPGYTHAAFHAVVEGRRRPDGVFGGTGRSVRRVLGSAV